VFVVGLAALHLRVAIVIELARLLLDFGLASKEHALRADDPGAAIVGERSEDVQDEGIVAVAGRWRPEARAASEAAKRVLKPFLAEDLFLELVLLFLSSVCCSGFSHQNSSENGKLASTSENFLTRPSSRNCGSVMVLAPALMSASRPCSTELILPMAALPQFISWAK
jgi:hypothetical protein